MNKTIGEKAVEYLEAKGFDGIMCGDSHLLHEIAEYCGIQHRGFRTEKQILDAIDRCNLFEKKYIKLHRLLRSFEIKKPKNIS